MNIWKRYSMRVSKNWVKFNKMFTLSPWVRNVGSIAVKRDLIISIEPELGIKNGVKNELNARSKI